MSCEHFSTRRASHTKNGFSFEVSCLNPQPIQGWLRCERIRVVYDFTFASLRLKSSTDRLLPLTPTG